MNYPLISEYIDAIKAAEDNFEELTNLRPVLGDDGQPVMTSGNFAVVFKMEDTETGKFYALKCFTKEQEGRAEAYHQIADALKDVDSPYLVSLRYLDKELFVDTEQTAETEFPVLLMDWVEGKTLDKYLLENLDDKYALEMLTYRFSQLAQWLIPQSFAHGDLKPDNILVREDGTLVLVDYDGMYVPAMKGQKARELGSPDFRHPLRTENDFDEHIDDFPIISVLISLRAISIKPELWENYDAAGRLLFSEQNYRDIYNCSLLNRLKVGYDEGIDVLCNCLYLFSSYYNFDIRDYLPPLSKLILYPKIKINRITSVSFDEWESKQRKDQGFSYYSKNGKKLFRVYDYLEGYTPDSSWYKDISEYSFDNRTVIVSDNCFMNCHNLRFLKMPSSIRYIGEKAFDGCFFHFIELPNSIEYISYDAFDNCFYLKNILVPPGSIDRFSKLLPQNITQLREFNKDLVKNRLVSFFEQSVNTESPDYWTSFMALLKNVSLICGINVEFNFSKIGDMGIASVKYDETYYDYHINSTSSLNDIVDACYYLFLDLIGVELFVKQ